MMMRTIVTINARVTDYPQSTGADSLLLTALQTRNNARVIFSGSIDLFSNKYFASSVSVPGSAVAARSGNEELSGELMSWLFGGRGRLRASAFQHRLSGGAGGPLNPAAYRVNDAIEVSVQLEELDAATDRWRAFVAKDVQIELVMIDPYIRRTLSSDRDSGRFHTAFKLPDVYGVFKLVLRYEKAGYSNLLVQQQVSVHPFRHDQFERFIDVAYPYYASAFSCMAAFVLFSFIFLYTKDSASPAAARRAGDLDTDEKKGEKKDT